jgi:hypothetical protein
MRNALKFFQGGLEGTSIPGEVDYDEQAHYFKSS